MPVIKATGTKTEVSTSAMATSAPPTSSIVRSVASRGPSPSSMLRCTASTTTMASSTTRPMESTSPNSVRVLMEKPSISKAAKVPMRDTGTASMGMSVARTVPRNRNTTSKTSRMASNSVRRTSVTDSFTKSVESMVTL
ncbi:MAG: hypothetical protein BWY76_03271 [bacterium ADurb.Bin429]|nr:MAG: hypothetical protein BWY76_03271 [bacterium ADurb.Bin429]